MGARRSISRDTGRIDAYVSDLLEIVDSLSIKRCFFVGHSVSGMIGLLSSIARPHLFERIVMLASSPRYLERSGEGLRWRLF